MRIDLRRLVSRRLVAVAAFVLLLVLSFLTISDRRILFLAVSALLVFMGLTLFHEHKPAPSPVGRAADLGWNAAAEDDSEADDGDVGPQRRRA